METTNLPVKYRPRILEDFVGQDRVVSDLKSMFKRGRLPSSFLLTGPTGTGKTTLSRIIARYVNCSSPDSKTLQPCGECACCKMETPPDFIEVNAADARGIDDIRSLIQQSKNMPSLGRKRFIMLDEAHMLTSQSQNCLLKGLEEPSPNTVWIVSSMNHEKLLPAIAGRCTHLAMRPVSKEDMLPRLRRIARKEGVDFKKIEGADKVLDQLCDMSYGHMRNAVELLDRVISQASSGKVTADSLSAALSSTPDADYEEAAARVFAAVLQKDLKAFLASVAQIDNFRTLLFKMRWLLDYLLQNSVGAAKFTPKSAKLLSQMLRKDGTKLSLTKALDAQRSLVEIELRMNTVSIDERILFTTMMYDALKG